MSKTPEHKYTEKDFNNALAKLPANKQSQFTLMGHQTPVPAGHKVGVVQKAMFHAPAAVVDALHSQVMSKKTEDVAKPAKDTKAKFSGPTKEEKRVDLVKDISRRISKNQRDDRN